MAPTAAAPTGAPSVDWAVAARVAARLVRPGPAVDRAQASGLVADLHRAAAAAAEHVTGVTGMRPADGDPRLSRVHVVDRRTWARANTEMVGSLTAAAPPPPGERPPSAAGRVAGGLQAGVVLAALAGRVLGQFDPFSPRTAVGAVGPDRGRLLLVAPNVLTVERAMRVDPADFRLWVALHEQTHALQFATAPWLEAHLRARMAALLARLEDDDGPSTLDAARAALGRRDPADAGAPDVARDGARGGLPALLPPDARRAMDEVGAVMALLEGHADVAMDAVGRTVVPSVRQIRARFDRRRAGSRRAGAVVLRRLLGLDLKLAQYRDGATFVRRVRRSVGQDGLNAVWAAPEHLPSPHEITHPRAWVRRVHG